MQTDWLGTIERIKVGNRISTLRSHIDDRLSRGSGTALGADVARSLPVVKAAKSTLLVEDPATLWALGPERYRKLAEKYAELTPDRDHIAVDINVVERYQDVYPTKKQTGLELAELVHEAAFSFSRVALYFESSLENVDLPLLPSAAAAALVKQTSVDELEVIRSLPRGFRGEAQSCGWPVMATSRHYDRDGARREAFLSPGWRNLL